MTKFILRIFALCLALSGAASAYAGPRGATPPAIVNFSADLPSVTVDQLEQHTASVTLSWTVVNLSSSYHLALDFYQLNQWSAVFPGETLSSVASRRITVQPPLNFGPPMYRLSIVGSGNHVVEERIVTIPFDTATMSQQQPTIDSFTFSSQGVSSQDLASGQARIPVLWHVSHRLPTSNLLFEQVMEDGTAVPVELPREFLWITSAGGGEVAPVAPQTGTQITIRLRVIDMVNSTVYAEATVGVPVNGTASATAEATAIAVPAPVTTAAAAGVQVVSYAADRQAASAGGTVTLTWNVTGATGVSIRVIGPDHRYREWFNDQPISGSLTYTLPAGIAGTFGFQLVPLPEEPDEETPTVNVNVS